MLATQARLLIIDSDREAVRTLAAALHPHGVTAGAVADPADAANGVVRFGANLVLVSAELAGGRSGIDILQLLARDPRTLHIPVALLSSRPRGDELLDALRAGAADYLVKPLRTDVDLPVLLELAAQHPSPGAPFAAPAAERLLRIMERLQLSAELTTGDADHSARFEFGKLIGARAEVLSGEGALEALLATPEATFRALSAAPSARPPSVEVEIDLDVELETDAPAAAERTLRCLLVDDEPDLLKLFSAFLKRAGFEVTTANDGAQGFDLCLAQRPDVVVADLNMPHLDGWGLLRKIRTDVRVAETPVVFLSAQDDYRESLRAVGAGAQDYLSKASKMDLLAKRVRSVLEPREKLREAIAANRGAQGRIEQLGVRWILGELAGARRSGTVALADGLGVYNIGLQDGMAVFAACQQGQKRTSGAASLALTSQLRSGDLQFLPETPAPAHNLDPEPLEPLLERVGTAAARAEDEALEALMVRAAAVEVDGQIFALYERFCPPFGREVARFIRQGRTPKTILAESNLNPIEVVETLRDMVRRQVIRLRV